MEKTIYVQLLNEGTIVYRPVPAVEIAKNIYHIKGSEIYNPQDEIWEFPPGTIVLTKEKILSGIKVLIATEEQSPI